jgi:hypothetical protein
MRLPLKLTIGALCGLLHGVEAAHAHEPPRMSVKRLFAPAADVEQGVLRLPPPEATPTRSRALVLVDEFREFREFRAATPRMRVARFEFAHAGGPVRLVPLGVDACRWHGRLLVGDESIPLAGSDALVSRVTDEFASQAVFGIDDLTRSYELDAPRGACVVEFWGDLPAGTGAVLVVEDGRGAEGGPELVAHLASRVNRAGGTLELVVRGESAALRGLAPAVAVPVEPIGAWVTWSDGAVEPARIERVGKDGALRVGFANAREGDAIVRIDGLVSDGRGVPRQRSLFHLARVADGALIAGTATVHADPSISQWIHCDFEVAQAAPAETVFACAELWAVARGGERVLGWIGGLAEVAPAAGASIVRLGFDRRQVDLGAGEALVFRNVRLHERDGFATLDLRAEIVPEVEAALALDAKAQPDTPAWGGEPGLASVAVPEMSSFLPPVGSHVLVLSHGYCADSNPWPLSQFAGDAWPYENLETNLSNDAFAVDIALRAAQFKSYGIVGHSQGGCAALHLYTFYWSGLDWAGPGRLMQCVGSPLEGTPLAGNLAALGSALGIQCGSNYDITPDGAAVWLAGIPTAARAKLHTYTTTFTNVPFFYDYCNIVTDIFLSDPEDGVVEHAAGHIVGAQDMGLKTGWCHVSGMRDPAQTGDASRNAVLNAQGAR